MADPTDAGISEARLRDALESVVSRRSHSYNSSHALSIKWAADDSNSAQDVGHFQAILSTLQLPAAREYTISSADETPGWSVLNEVRNLLLAAKSSAGRSLAIIHYAGHGYVESNDSLFATGSATSKRRFNLDSQVIAQPTDDNWCLEEDDPVDVLFILDCCYAHVACRTLPSSSRTVEIIAATESPTPRALAPPRNTLTGKLRGEIARRRRDSHSLIEMAYLISSLRANHAVVKPTHFMKLGCSSICLPFSGPLPIDPRSLSPSLHAVISVHVSGNMTNDGLHELVRWIEMCPQSCSISLDGVYRTESTLLIIQCAWPVFSKLRGVRGIKLVAEVTSKNLWPQALVAYTGSETAMPPSGKENLPFSPSKHR